jgi:glycosyltransferase involved in cell wall biosynthesis
MIICILFKRIILKSYFALTVKRNVQIIAQTPVIAKRLTDRYKLAPNQVTIISQPAPEDVAIEFADAEPLPEIALNNKPIKLLFLATYYPHKNHQILLRVIEELKRRKVSEQVHFFLTIENTKQLHVNTYQALAAYPEMITNLGRLSSLKVAQAYRASTALFIPTLAESYGLIYLEAMLFGTPILTSDRDFAHWICFDTAMYFDPLSATSIADVIMKVPNIDRSSYQKAAVENLQRFPKDWSMVADQFAEVIRKSLCHNS